MIDGTQGAPALIPMLVGEVRYYDIDTSNDGGLPVGTSMNQLQLSAKNEIGDIDAPALVAGGLVSVDGNIVRVRITAANAGTYRITLTYNNAYGQPALCFWRFKIV